MALFELCLLISEFFCLAKIISHHCTKCLERDSYHILLEPIFFLWHIFASWRVFFQNSRKRKERMLILIFFWESFKKPKRNLLDLDLGRQLQQETKRRRE